MHDITPQCLWLGILELGSGFAPGVSLFNAPLALYNLFAISFSFLLSSPLLFSSSHFLHQILSLPLFSIFLFLLCLLLYLFSLLGTLPPSFTSHPPSLTSHPPSLPRSPSPEPIYSHDGKRLNTREVRTRKRLEDRRHDLIQEAITLNPEYRPPTDYKLVSLLSLLQCTGDLFIVH